MKRLPPPAPQRKAGAVTTITAADLGRALAAMGVSQEQFCRLTGVNQSRFDAQLKGEISDALPRWYEVVLFVLYRHPDLRTWCGPIGLPLTEWGITREMRRGDRPKSDLLGAEIGIALQAMGVGIRHFARLGGINSSRVQRLLKTDKGNDDIPLFMEILLFALYHHPELRVSGAPVDLPVEEWGLAIAVDRLL